MVHTYTATLVHEFGHNLGLRHNFAGSADRDNFYSKKEATDLGMHDAPAYSSIMDYAYSDLNELSTYGKYDIAALKFAYSRKVDLVTRKVFPDATADEVVEVKEQDITTSLADLEKALEKETEKLNAQNPAGQPRTVVGMKAYDFCTDSNAGLSATCNRFDEGTNYVEIANHHADRYFSEYKTRKWRDGRLEFTDYGTDSHVGGTEYRFKRMRMIYETFEFFSSIFGPGLMEQGCGEADLAQYKICTTINEVRDSARIAGDFFLTVLKTPDFTCAVADLNDENKEVIDFMKMKDIFDDLRFDIEYVPSSCFDPVVQQYLSENTIRNPQTGATEPAPLVAVAETGLFYDDIKDPSPKFPFSNDLAVRGTWTDKLLAVKYLTNRKVRFGLNERDNSSMLDHSQIRQDFNQFIGHLALRAPLQGLVPFQKENGELVEFPYEFAPGEYTIKNQSDYNVKMRFDLPIEGDHSFTEKIFEHVIRYHQTSDINYRDSSNDYLESMSIIKRLKDEGQPGSGVLVRDQGRFSYRAADNNQLGQVLIQDITLTEQLTQIGAETVVKVLDARTKLPEGTTEDEKLVFETFTVEQIEELKPLIAILPPGGDNPPELAAAINLGVEGLDKVIELKNTMATPPADATDQEKALYQLPVPVLDAFRSGEMTRTAEHMQGVLELLPDQNRKPNFDIDQLLGILDL